jgi:hypothetical protein
MGGCGDLQRCVSSKRLSGVPIILILKQRRGRDSKCPVFLFHSFSRYVDGTQTAGVVETFFLAMTLHQDAQRNAQDELNETLGEGVLPTLADRERLPYTEALILEVFRKYSIGTFGTCIFP